MCSNFIFMRFRFRYIFFVSFILLLTYATYVYFSDQAVEIYVRTDPRSIIQSPTNDKTASQDAPEEQSIDDAELTEKGYGVNYNVHIFYYPWYGNPTFDNGSYYHWNHNILPEPGAREVEQQFRYKPPEDIGADFYPQLGCYSSRDPEIIKQHFQWIRDAGIGTIVISWYPPGMSTEQGHYWGDLIPTLLDAANEHRLKIAFHIEPYKNRNIDNLRQNFAYILDNYGSHPAFYRHRRRKNEEPRPLIYVYDSYLIPDAEWRTLLWPSGGKTIRRSSIDFFVIGLLVENHQKTTLASAGFDGYYTYFAADGFSFGSTLRNWRYLAHSAKRMNKIFIPAVGPGYIDKAVRPWNSKNFHARGANGEYYSEAWETILGARTDFVAITSFNEWHEGTQIEPAVPHSSATRKYLDYSPLEPMSYMRMTSDWVKKFSDRFENIKIET